MSNDLPNTPGAGANSSEPNSFAPPSDANFADHTRLVSQDTPSVATPSFGAAPTKPLPSQPSNPAVMSAPPLGNSPAGNPGAQSQTPWGATPPPSMAPNQGVMPSGNPMPPTPPNPGFGAPVPTSPYSSAPYPGASMPGGSNYGGSMVAGNSTSIFTIYIDNFKDIWQGNLTSAFERVRNAPVYSYTLIGVITFLSALTAGGFGFSKTYSGAHALTSLLGSRVDNYASDGIMEGAIKAGAYFFFTFLLSVAVIALAWVCIGMVYSRIGNQAQKTPVNFSQATAALGVAWSPLPIFLLPLLFLALIPSGITVLLGSLVFMVENIIFIATAYLVFYKAIKYYSNLQSDNIAHFGLIFGGFIVLASIVILVILMINSALFAQSIYPG